MKRDWLIAGLVAVLIPRLLYVGYVGHAFEDAYINIRCAVHWLETGYPNYNIGHTVMSVTSAVWLIFTTFAVGLAGPAHDPSHYLFVLTIGLDLLAYWMVATILLDTAMERLIWTIGWALIPAFILNAGYGLEMNLLICAAVASVALRATFYTWLRLGCLALVAAIRPEGVVYALVIALALPYRKWSLVAVAAGTAVQFGLNLALWHTLIPQSVVAKSQSYGVHWFKGYPYLDWLWPSRGNYFAELAPFSLIAVAWVPGVRQLWYMRGVMALMLAGLAVLIGYFVFGVFAFRWYPVPAAAFTLIAASVMLPRLCRNFTADVILVLLFSLAAISSWPRVLAEDRRRLAMEEMYFKIGEKAKEAGVDGKVVVLEPAGIIPWHIPNSRIIDEVGIVDPEVSRDRSTTGDGWLYRVSERNPDVFITRLGDLGANEPLGGAGKPFASAEQLRLWAVNYGVIGREYVDSVPGVPAFRGMMVISLRRQNPDSSASFDNELKRVGVSLVERQIGVVEN